MVMYNREAAVHYAHKWWNSHNPAFPSFAVDCTNFVSQCLLAVGASMRGYHPDRAKGWWLGGGTWSFSWSVAHSLRWYLEGSKSGLKATRKSSPETLLPGDVIIYDFDGDSRMDHAAIVVSNPKGVPLVNAHTSNSRNRHWSYTTSPAYKSDIRYYFFHIDENTSV
jgi:cell wall-associated NlpC family hydrolase